MRRSGIRKRKEKVDGNVGFFLYVVFQRWLYGKIENSFATESRTYTYKNEKTNARDEKIRENRKNVDIKLKKRYII